MKRNFWADERGATSPIGLMVACALIITVAVVVNAMLVSSARAAAQVAAQRGDASTLEAYATSMKDVSTDGLAVAIPATDVTGAANADGHAFLVYSRDGKNNPHFTEWVCSGACAPGAAGGTLTAYTFTTFSNPSATLKTISTPQTGVTMQATYLLASQLANPAVSDHAAYFQAAGVTNVPDRLVQLGYPGVEGGNRITVVKIASKSNAYDLHLLPLAAPTTGQTVVVGYLKAIPNPLDLTPIAAFANAAAGAQTSYAQETNYPTTSSYTESDTCAGVVTITPNGGIATGPNAPYTIVPVASDLNGGNCEMTVTDVDDQQASIAISVGKTIPPLVAGSPYCAASTSNSISVNSSAPTGGTGPYSVTYTITSGPNAVGASGSASYALTSAATLIANSAYTIATEYFDSGGMSVSGPSLTCYTALPPLEPGSPYCDGTTENTIAVNSTPPTGGSGSGYSVTYTIIAGPGGDAVGASATVSYYIATDPDLPPDGAFTVSTVYNDSSGDHVAGADVTCVTNNAPPATPPPTAPPTVPPVTPPPTAPPTVPPVTPPPTVPPTVPPVTPTPSSPPTIPPPSPPPTYAPPSCPVGDTGTYPNCVPPPTPTPDPYTAVKSNGSHEVIGVGFASWGEVDVDYNGTREYEVCYGTGSGPVVKTSDLNMAYYYTEEQLEGLGVPSSVAGAAESGCASL